MLVGTDNSHFRKYLTTLGISVIAGSISLAGLFYNLQGDLLIPQEDLDKLTPIARTTIERRQSYLEIAATVAPWVLIALITAGAALTYVGLRGWASRQQTIDSREDLEVQKLGIEIQQLSDAQRVDALEEQVREVTSESTPEPHSAPDTSSRPTVPSGSPAGTSAIRASILETEAAIANKLREHFGPERVLTQVVMTTPTRRAEFDAIVKPVSGEPGLVIETKYTGHPANLKNRIIDGAVRAAEGASLLSSQENQNYQPAVILIHPEMANAKRRLREARATLEASFAHPISIVMLTQQELEALDPAELAQQLTASSPD